MNVLELLTKEIKDKNWTLPQKHRYIYIRSCELFSFDRKYNFYFDLKNGNELLQKTKSRVIDLENIEDNCVICTSYTKIFFKIEKELLNPNQVICNPMREWNELSFKTEIEINNTGHVWNRFHNGYENINADATNQNDLSRVKMKFSTNGYLPVAYEDCFFEKLKHDDQKISYIENEYNDYKLKKRRIDLVYEFRMSPFMNDSKNYQNDFYLYELKVMKEIFESYHFTNYQDAEYCISYLFLNFLPTLLPMDNIPLYQISSNNDWGFANIYIIHIEKDIIYLALYEEDKQFYFHEISKEDAINYANNYEGKSKNLILSI